jgi:hypothetical protein
MNLFRSTTTGSIAQKFWYLIVRDARRVNGSDAPSNTLQKLADTVIEWREKALASRPVLHQFEESVFIRTGDYWIIRYQGQAAIVKATRGLDYIGYLLRHPARNFHVTELRATTIDLPAPASLGSLRESGGAAVNSGLQDAGPILDSRAKSEYKRRIDELRKDMDEAERLNDFHRATRSRNEMDAIAEQLATAVGLRGRDRRAFSDVERARSAVTKRIKEAINRIGRVIPALGRHLAVRIKTGYFCSYNPHQDCSVAWTVLLRSH